MDERKNEPMVAGKTTCVCGAGCKCGCGAGCGGGAMCGRGHCWIWWIVGIVILFAVFAVGIKVGEIRVELRGLNGGGYYRRTMMVPSGPYNGGVPSVAYPAGGPQGAPTGTSTGL